MGKAINRLKEDWKQKISGLSLREWADKLCRETRETAIVVENPGTIMKLLFLWNYMRFPYLHIMTSQRKKQRIRNRNAKLFYFDPYAGNGIIEVRHGNKSIRIPGSSMLALLAPALLSEKRRPNSIHDYYWDIVVLNDIEEDYRTQLKNRSQIIFDQLSTSKPRYSFSSDLPSAVKDEEKIIAITAYNCEEEYTWLNFKQFFDRMKGDRGWVHGLIFLDPPSPSAMPLGFMKHLLSVPSDVIALLHTGMFAELVNTKRISPNTLAKILDCDITEADSLLQQSFSTELLEEVYVETFVNLLKYTVMQGISSGSRTRDVILPIRLRTGKRHYHLVVATRTTGGQQFERWQNWLKEFAKEVEKLSDLDLPLFDILSDVQATLDS